MESPQISRLPLSGIDCPVQEAGLSWWNDRSGVAELNHDPYLAISPHLQLVIDEVRDGAPRFIYVGEQSFAAKLLGERCTSAFHAGEWWDDGGYAEAVSGSYDEVSKSGEPVLEEIKARVRLPERLYPISEATIHYERLCLRTCLANGMKTITVITKAVGKTILKKSF
ncbi:MAG: hypothetical protein GY948_12095 [Alphaproteobacteria bacterium]|nr:hypothetical protein [Alphaproteobacteria bacterium]